MRVLMLNWKDRTHPLAGGAEEYTQQVARRLAELGHDVTLFAAAVDGQPDREMLEGYRIVRGGGRFTVYRAARHFWRTEGEGNFDVVVDECNTRPFLSPRYVATVPVVGLIHQVAKEVWRFEMPFPVSWVGRHIFEPRWLNEYSAIPVMTISQSSAESLEAYGLRNLTVLPIGADPIRRPDVARSETPHMLFLGRLSKNKRPDHAIEAFRLARTAVPDLQLTVLGDGPMRQSLERDLPDGAVILGHVSYEEREERLAMANVLVATSVREGWGLNVSEAAAVETPTIGYRVDGLRDSIPESGGHLVDPDPDSLAKALVEFFAGRLELTPRISTVPWAEVGDAVEAVLIRVIAERAAGSPA
jgi:glycosyltransferase involved in cell wall biosynthesis